LAAAIVRVTANNVFGARQMLERILAMVAVGGILIGAAILIALGYAIGGNHDLDWWDDDFR
jgi:hypothetical protein